MILTQTSIIINNPIYTTIPSQISVYSTRHSTKRHPRPRTTHQNPYSIIRLIKTHRFITPLSTITHPQSTAYHNHKTTHSTRPTNSLMTVSHIDRCTRLATWNINIYTSFTEGINTCILVNLDLLYCPEPSLYFSHPNNVSTKNHIKNAMNVKYHLTITKNSHL